jgi:hypothetical protein
MSLRERRPSGAGERREISTKAKNGAQGRNRTTDTAIFSRMLYQLSYLGETRRPNISAGSIRAAATL